MRTAVFIIGFVIGGALFILLLDRWIRPRAKEEDDGRSFDPIVNSDGSDDGGGD